LAFEAVALGACRTPASARPVNRLGWYNAIQIIIAIGAGKRATGEQATLPQRRRRRTAAQEPES
jgi:hypothetical protein